jgi:oxaloacetate decarboxylase alpha subunit
LNLQEIKELIKIIDETEISELNLESDGVKISIRKGPSVVTGIPVTAIARQEGVERSVAPSTVQPTPSIEAFSKAPDPVVPTNAEMITSPMVGTFYSSQSPEAPAFVNVGQQVKVGQPVCIVEAMKLMNEIESEIEGKIIQILVENGQPVEYGQPLFIIENKEK